MAKKPKPHSESHPEERKPHSEQEEYGKKKKPRKKGK
jgi:hypothetical protein